VVVVLVVVYDMITSLAAVGNFQKTGPAIYCYKRYSKRKKRTLHPFITPILALECASSVTTVVRLTQGLNLRANHKGSDTNDISKTWLPQWKND